MYIIYIYIKNIEVMTDPERLYKIDINIYFSLYIFFFLWKEFVGL